MNNHDPDNNFLGVYVHYPFCRRTCFYCHFTRFPHTPPTAEKLIDRICAETELRFPRPGKADSLFLGGGSPSLLDDAQLNQLMTALKRHVQLNRDAEITFEANPDDVTEKKLADFKKNGFNRISLGTQSFCAGDLKYLQRTHDVQAGIRAVHSASAAGFSNISVDFIIGLPGQTEQSLQRNFRTLADLPVNHVSVYLFEYPVNSTRSRPESDFILYNCARNCLSDLNFEQYEVSNFARPGFKCRHNLKYWENREYVGLGPGASGFIRGIDYTNIDTLSRYESEVTANRLPVKEENCWSPDLRCLVTGLRLSAGVAPECFSRHFRELNFLLQEKMLVEKGDRVAVNPSKILLLNEILSHFFRK